MPFGHEIAGKSGAGQGTQGEKKEIPPSQSTDHNIILRSQGNRSP